MHTNMVSPTPFLHFPKPQGIKLRKSTGFVEIFVYFQYLLTLQILSFALTLHSLRILGLFSELHLTFTKQEISFFLG